MAMPLVSRRRRRSVSAFMIESAPEDSQMYGDTLAMSSPSGPRFGARRMSRLEPFVPV